VTPAQCRAARGLANMSMARLAAAAVVPAAVIYDFEGEFGKPKPADLTALQGALERAGRVEGSSMAMGKPVRFRPTSA
jgi:hypothetical protein